jgi:ribosomal protein S6--L-glutamate ligase
MRIAILSGGQGWHVRDLQRAAQDQGYQVDVVDFRRVSSRCAAGASPLDATDAIIVRTMPPGSLEQVVFRMDCLHRAEQRGIRVLNPVRALEICIDKFLATARLEAAGLPVPRTIVCQTADDALQAFGELGGNVVVKPLFGSEGRGMVRIEDADVAWRVFRTLERTQAVLYLQEFVAHPGWDLRVLVLGGTVRAAMKRYARQGWRTNVALGGHAESVPVHAVPGDLALRAAQACGAVAAGVDLLPAPDGSWRVLEVNAVPGWRALARVTGLDVAAELITFLRHDS